MDEMRYIWVLHNGDFNAGRVGYYVTATKMNRSEAEALAKHAHTRLVMPILETGELPTDLQLTAQQ